MEIAATAASAILAAMVAFAAARKLGHSDPVVASYERVGVPESRLNLLAGLLLAGGAGLLLGIVWRPIGIAAAACLVVYFAAAVVAHVRSRAMEDIAVPIALLALAAAALTLGAGS
jgi:hypothetical protein